MNRHCPSTEKNYLSISTSTLPKIYLSTTCAVFRWKKYLSRFLEEYWYCSTCRIMSDTKNMIDIFAYFVLYVLDSFFWSFLLIANTLQILKCNDEPCLCKKWANLNTHNSIVAKIMEFLGKKYLKFYLMIFGKSTDWSIQVF